MWDISVKPCTRNDCDTTVAPKRVSGSSGAPLNRWLDCRHYFALPAKKRPYAYFPNTAADPKRARTAVGFSGESSHPVWACKRSDDVATSRMPTARKRLNLFMAFSSWKLFGPSGIQLRRPKSRCCRPGANLVQLHLRPAWKLSDMPLFRRMKKVFFNHPHKLI